MQHCNQPTSLPSAINATCISATSQRSPLRTLRTYSRLCCPDWGQGGRTSGAAPAFPGSLKASRNSSGTISPQVMGLGTPRPVPAVASITRETFRSSVQGGEDRLSQALEPGRGVPVPHPPLGTCGPDLHEVAPPADQALLGSRPLTVRPCVWFVASLVPAHRGYCDGSPQAPVNPGASWKTAVSLGCHRHSHSVGVLGSNLTNPDRHFKGSSGRAVLTRLTLCQGPEVAS